MSIVGPVVPFRGQRSHQVALKGTEVTLERNGSLQGQVCIYNQLITNDLEYTN